MSELLPQKGLVAGLLVVLILVSCQELGVGEGQTSDKSLVQTEGETNQPGDVQENDPTISKIQTQDATTASDLLKGFKQSTYSKFVYFGEGKKKILIDYNFFPEGTDFDSQLKQVSIPCSYGRTENSGLNVTVSSTDEAAAECEPYLLDVAGAKFTLAGLELEFDQSFELFSREFGVTLTRDGFFDSESGEEMEVPFSEASLENVAPME